MERELELKIELERSELAILVLHLNIMRKPIKKGFKSNYGHFEGRKMIKFYDELKERFENEISEDQNLQSEIISFDLVTEEINMLSSFLNWYVQEYKKMLADKPNEELEILESIQNKLTGLIEVAAEQILREAL
jgi:hypothetical protein